MIGILTCLIPQIRLAWFCNEPKFIRSKSLMRTKVIIEDPILNLISSTGFGRGNFQPIGIVHELVNEPMEMLHDATVLFYAKHGPLLYIFEYRRLDLHESSRNYGAAHF